MVTNTGLPELLTVKQAAKGLGMSKCSIYRWIKRGWIVPVRLPNGTIRIPLISLDKILTGK